MDHLQVGSSDKMHLAESSKIYRPSNYTLPPGPIRWVQQSHSAIAFGNRVWQWSSALSNRLVLHHFVMATFGRFEDPLAE